MVAASVRVRLRLRYRSETRPLGADLRVSLLIPQADDAHSPSCSAKPPAKGKDGVIQLLDYNISRFDFQDLKGKQAVYDEKFAC